MSLRSRTSRRTRIALASAVAGGIALTGVTAGTAFATSPAAATVAHASASVRTQAETVTRAEVLRRAATWLTANNGSQVPYSQSKVWSDGYRQDCSGYVSMTLGLWKSGPNTVELATNRSLTTPITLGELQPGDLLIDADGSNTTRHVVIFEGWTDSSHSAYSAFEQRGGHGTDHRVLTYGLNAGSEFKPYRPVNISDSGTPTDPPQNPSPSWPTVGFGASGADATTVQYLLTSRGYSTSSDGIFLWDTEAKVKAFQSANGLTADGVVGPATWAKLVTTVQRGSSGDAVRALQKQLTTQGNSLSIDGSFGPATEAAVKSFQQAKGLTADGSVGLSTWAALLSA
ncbi:peptidoglycan-binding protein [Streptomyces sp. NPDC004752]